MPCRRRIHRAERARPAGDAPRHAHSDQLGSERLAAWTNQTLASEEAYAPFGEAYAGAGAGEQMFTGKGQRLAAGIYDFPFRHYSPAQGRWLSPDPSGLAAVNPANPQSWNAYAYVANQPLTATDPLGLGPIGLSGAGSCPGYYFHDGTLYFCDSPAAGLTGPWNLLSPSFWDFSIGEYPPPLQNPTGQTGGGGGGNVTTSAAKKPQTPGQQACGPAPGRPSMGDSVSVSTVNPFTSGNGGIWGGNRQSFGSFTNGYTSNNYTYSGKGLGLDIGASVQSVWAWGSGSWAGPFRSINVSLGLFSGSIFWTPGKGGWTGFSFGLGVSPPIPQAAYEVTTYTCKSGPG